MDVKRYAMQDCNVVIAVVNSVIHTLFLRKTKLVIEIKSAQSSVRVNYNVGIFVNILAISARKVIKIVKSKLN